MVWRADLNKSEIIPREIEKRAHKEFLPIVSPEKGHVLAKEIRKAKLNPVLEVSALIGYSAIIMEKTG